MLSFDGGDPWFEAIREGIVSVPPTLNGIKDEANLQVAVDSQRLMCCQIQSAHPLLSLRHISLYRHQMSSVPTYVLWEDRSDEDWEVSLFEARLEEHQRDY